MILSDVSSKPRRSRKWIGLVLLGLILLGFGFYMIPRLGFFFPKSTTNIYFCDVETTVGKHFLGDDGQLFNGVNTQKDNFAFSGRYSSKVGFGEGAQFGIGFKLEEFRAGETYKASVWRYRPFGGPGFLVVSGKGEGEFYKGVDYPVSSEKGWEKLEVTFKIPFLKKYDEFKIYVYSTGANDVYFDDLKIERVAFDSTTFLEKLPIVELRIDDAGMRKLEKKRAAAYRAGILERAENDWVKGKLKNEGSDEDIKVELRLKGDWLDHLEGDKWSFRIKTKGEQVWNRLRYFSFHTPKARAYLHEWLLHKLFEKEDVLTTKYDFVIVKLNGKNLGIYAYEEHFDKILVERQKRREGPIVRFSEDGFWAAVKRNSQQHGSYDFNLKQYTRKPEASEIKPFGDTKIVKSPTLKDQFEIAQNLLYQYKYGLRKAEEIFDIERMAKYYAICDAMNAYHGLAWHNQRFYYNPVTSKLEPIGYDGFGTVITRHDDLLGSGALNKKRLKKEEIDNLLFMNKSFTERYAFYLEKYSSRSFLEAFLAEFEEELSFLEGLIQSEFDDYKINREDLIIYAQRMYALLIPFNNLSIKAYTESSTGDSKNLKIANFHGLPVELIGAGPVEKLMTDTFENKLLLEGFVTRKVLAVLNEGMQGDTAVDVKNKVIWSAYSNQEAVSFSELAVKKNDKYLFFNVLGVDSVFYSKILDWQAPRDFSPPRDLITKSKLKSNNIFNVSEGMVYFKKGKHSIQESIIIPKGFRVIFSEGAQLDFVKNAKFISYSPVFMKGTADDPIKIYSSDQTGNGFTIVQAEGESDLRYVLFEDLNTLDYKGWKLTGGVTFYESDVAFNYCSFQNNHCEDALNIIRSEFSLNNSVVSNTFSDGLDADFCKGYINNTRFQNTTNDAMDFSGSNILIQECTVDNAGDKGVSVGEDTDASIFSIEIKNSNIGVAAKDLSTLVIKKIKLLNCEQGFVAYQKKPEYGGGNIVVQNYTAEGVRRLHNIRKNSVLHLKNKLIKGQ
jgi:CotH kinase protein